VTYTLTTGAYPRRWDSVDLDHDPLDATRWFKSVPLSSLQSAAKLADIRFMAQATNTQGAVGLATNAGTFFTPHEPFVTVSAPKRATTLSLVNPPSSGTYRSGTGTLSARLSEDAGGVSQAAAGRRITFTIGSLRAYGTTDATGTATASLTLLALPGSYQLIAPIESETVFFIVAPTGGGAATVVTTTTSPDGTATAVGLVLPIGSYNVTVRFGENITAPIVYDATSSRYAGSDDGGTVAVTRAPLTIKANDASRRFGNANPTFTGTITGLAPGDNISATYSTTATPTSPLGTYPIVPTAVDPGSKLGNYSLTKVNGTLTVGPPALVFTSNRDGNNEIYAMNADGTAQTRLTNNTAPDVAPVASPDGKKVVFTRTSGGNTDIFVMNADGTAQTRLTTNAGVDMLPTFSPDGKKIAFVSDRDGNNEIYVMNADGSLQTRITNNAAVDTNPVYSPDGMKIAFTSGRGGNQDVYVMNVNGTGVTRLTTNSAIDRAGSWSTTGKIAFVSTRDGNLEIYVMNADGNGQTRLTTSPASDVAPAFSADGSRIYFTSTRDGNAEIYVMNASNGIPQTRLTNNPAADSLASGS
ncbi:MAG: DUF5050 domain-containing protein, partial [Chloroflexi bacterium]